jgi:hypothetical protein
MLGLRYVSLALLAASLVAVDIEALPFDDCLHAKTVAAKQACLRAAMLARAEAKASHGISSVLSIDAVDDEVHQVAAFEELTSHRSLLAKWYALLSSSLQFRHAGRFFLFV